jgi:[glutamine synthetase] adenylyltransferase / [glutamine synthetase]-adenylyl-L-tyrosine phosphorylase
MFINKQKSSSRIRNKDEAEETIRLLAEYTPQGFAYKVDMRLRPDGSKGILANDIAAFETYYLNHAHPWEIQALLKARAIAGDIHLMRAFQHMKKQIILRRGYEISGSDMVNMRKRIIREISKEAPGYDIKNGPGGIKEIEFLIQYLQLKHCAELPDLIVNNSITAIKRLTAYGILDGKTEGLLLHAYGLLRTIDTLLRLNEENRLNINSELVDIIIKYLKIQSKDDFIKQIDDTRQKILGITKRFYKKT